MKALAVLLLVAAPACAQSPAALRLRPDLTREAQAVFGIASPVPVFAAQIEQESGWRADITAWDNGRGLAQFMDPTARFIAQKYPELGTPDPYNPRWAIRALVRLNAYNFARVQGDTSCERWGATLKSYNAGIGFVKRAQVRSAAPGQWFGVTEDVNAGQGTANFEASRMYPRKVLFDRQPRYALWGATECL